MSVALLCIATPYALELFNKVCIPQLPLWTPPKTSTQTKMDTVRRFANLEAPQQVRSLAGEQEPSGLMPEASLCIRYAPNFVQLMRLHCLFYLSLL